MTQATPPEAELASDPQPDCTNHPFHPTPSKPQADMLHLQAELLAVQEGLDTLVHLMRDSRSQTASLTGLAAILDNVSSQAADVSLQLAA